MNVYGGNSFENQEARSARSETLLKETGTGKKRHTWAIAIDRRADNAEIGGPAASLMASRRTLCAKPRQI